MQYWKRPQNYIGSNWDGWLVFLSRNRDSSLLDNHNFDVAMETLRPLAMDVPDDDCAGVQVVRENHFLVGWIEWIAIHRSNTAAIHAAELLEAKLESYPILSEMEYSRKEWEVYCEAWQSWGHREFVRALEREGLIEEGACDECDPEATREAFEALNPCGDFQDDGAPVIRRSIDRAKRDGLNEAVCELLGLQTA